MLLLTTLANKAIFSSKSFKKKINFLWELLPYLYIPSLFFNAGLIFNDQIAYYGGHYLNNLQFRITLSLLIGSLLVVRHYQKSKYAWALSIILLGNILIHPGDLFLISLFKAGVFVIKIVALFISLKFYLYPTKDYHVMLIKNYLLTGVLILQSGLVLIQYFTQKFVDFLPLYWLGQSRETYFGGSIAYVENVFSMGSGDLIMRSYGTLPHPNILAGLSLLAIILLFPTRRIWRYGWFASVTALGIIFFTTFSKTAILGFIILLVVWQIESLGYNKRLIGLKKKLFGLRVLTKFHFTNAWLFLVGTIANVGIVGGLWLFNQSIYFEFSYVRSLLNGGAGKIIRLFPIGGVGWYHFMPYLINHDILLNYQSKFVQPVHNIWLLLVAELGFFFTIGLLSSSIYLWQKMKIAKTNTQGHLFVWLIILGGLDHYLITYILG